MQDRPMSLFVFGYGYTAAALARRLVWPVIATARTPEKAAELTAQGVAPVDPGDPEAMAAAMAAARAILITAPPTELGCPGLRVIAPALARSGAFPDWIGYLSTTGVYGGRDGRWVFERSPLNAASVEGGRRVAAERDWRQTGRDMGLTVCSFRLPGIYGPGRGAFDRLRAGTAKRIVKPGQVFSRIHVEDIAAALALSIERPRARAIYNIADDEPAPPQDVIAHAAGLLGMEIPPAVPFADAQLTPAAERFWRENRRVANALAKAELGWRPAYPTYREGLAAILAAGE
jgi:nucleoside-diphosphate-sugar epimerase